MNIWFYSLASVVAISFISFVGIFSLSLSEKSLGKALIYMISFAAGGLFGDAFIHLLPEAVEEFGFGTEMSLYILLGIVVSLILEKFIHWRHCHHPTTEEHPHPFAMMNLFGDSVHNFMDGLIIGGSYMVSVPVGIATTVAVILHEIPQEIGDFGVLLHGGFSKKKALFFNFLTALTAVLGVVVVLIFGEKFEGLEAFLLPFAAGGFIYIAGSDLIPELHKREPKFGQAVGQLVLFVGGIGVMCLLLLIG